MFVVSDLGLFCFISFIPRFVSWVDRAFDALQNGIYLMVPSGIFLDHSASIILSTILVLHKLSKFTDLCRGFLSSKIDLVPNGFVIENCAVSSSIILYHFERKKFYTKVSFFLNIIKICHIFNNEKYQFSLFLCRNFQYYQF